MIARIADRLGVELPLISVFEAPTIRGLALRVAAARQRKSVVPDAIPATGAPGRSMSTAHYVFPASFAQQRRV
jgi:hypothetical protein